LSIRILTFRRSGAHQPDNRNRSESKVECFGTCHNSFASEIVSGGWSYGNTVGRATRVSQRSS